jgi:Piwi domain
MSTVRNSTSQRGQANRNRTGTEFVLNTAQVQFESGLLVNAGFIPYQDHDQLRSLRDKHRSTHLIRRHRLRDAEAGESTSQIVAIPFVEHAPKVGETFRQLKLDDNLGHTAALIRESLISFFAAFPRRVFGYQPVTFMGDGDKDNLVVRSLPQGIVCPDWLGISPMFEIEVRVIEAARDEPYIGISLNVFTRRRIDATCQQLMDEGFSVIGHYVGRRVESSDPRIEAKFQLVGRAVSVEDGVIQLADHRQDVEEIPADGAFIEAAAFDEVSHHVFGSDYRMVKSRLDTTTNEFRQGGQKLARIERLRSYIDDHPLEFLNNQTWKCGQFVSEGEEGFPKIQTAPRVTYVFDSTGQKTDTWQVRGLNQHGPYSTPTFTPSEPSVCIICQKAHRGRVEQFVRKFLHGIPQASQGGQRQRMKPFDTGFIRKYAVQDMRLQFFEVDGKSADAYRKATHRALQTQTEKGTPFDLALVEIEESFHAFKRDDDPYLVTKAEFLSHQIPVQEFEFETTEIPDHRLHYVLNNMALATYAKLGGTPWLVQANQPIAHELVIGLGSAHVGDGRLGERERVVGITTVFSGDGNYCVSNVSKAVSFDNYEPELLDSLRQTISRVSTSMNWQPKDHVRLVFHSFKPFKQVEADAVKKLVTELGDYQTEYAFIHVVNQHPFVLFDRQQVGVTAYDGSGKNKGALAPERGKFLRISGNETLIVLTGPKELKQSSDGMPSPILLRLGRGSTFRDLPYLTRQVNTFACHSWRGFDNSPLPVTLMYSELIARLLGKLGTVSFWNPSQMIGKIGETRWFL